MNYYAFPKPTTRELRNLLISTVIVLTFAFLSGCANGGLFDVEAPDCSITVMDASAKAGFPPASSIDAMGKVLVRRGDCTREDIEIYKKAARL